jgi:DNA-binding transcriptional MerR regulator
MEKAPDAFRTISEVAADLNVPQHVLRFWESRFSEIKPMKRGGGRRYYRPEDVDLLRGIRHLLYGEGYTIRGVQRILKDQGLRYVQTVWQPGAAGALAPVSEDVDFAGDESESFEQPGRERGRGLFGLLPSLIGNANDVPIGKGSTVEDAETEEDEEEADEEVEADSDDSAEVDEDYDDSDEEESDDDESDEDEEDQDEDEDEEDDKRRSIFRQAQRPLILRRPPEPIGGPLRAAVSFDDMRRLESALDELAECRKLLDLALDEKV